MPDPAASMSSEELLHRYAAGERSFSDADLHDLKLFDEDLGGADLRGSRLRGAQLIRVNLRGAKLEGADLSGANLGGASLEGADLRNTNLGKANLHNATLVGANLENADLRDANLCNATEVLGALHGAVINLGTCSASGFDEGLLIRLVARGVVIADFNEFLPRLRHDLLAALEGLILRFDTRVTVFDNFLLQLIAFALLGASSQCEFGQLGGAGTSVRASASPEHDLAQLARGLWGECWNKPAMDPRSTLAQTSRPYRDELDVLRSRLEAIDLVRIVEVKPKLNAPERPIRSAVQIAVVDQWEREPQLAPTGSQ